MSSCGFGQDAGVKIAKALGITVEELVTGESYEKPDPELRAIGRLAKGLEPRKRRLALEILKTISKLSFNF